MRLQRGWVRHSDDWGRRIRSRTVFGVLIEGIIQTSLTFREFEFLVDPNCHRCVAVDIHRVTASFSCEKRANEGVKRVETIEHAEAQTSWFLAD